MQSLTLEIASSLVSLRLLRQHITSTSTNSCDEVVGFGETLVLVSQKDRLIFLSGAQF